MLWMCTVESPYRGDSNTHPKRGGLDSEKRILGKRCEKMRKERK